MAILLDNFINASADTQHEEQVVWMVSTNKRDNTHACALRLGGTEAEAALVEEQQVSMFQFGGQVYQFRY